MATASALDTKSLVLPDPLPLDSGQRLESVRVAYETYGELAPDKSNVILIFHALSGDQHVASTHPITGKPGWWSRMVGPGKPIDTARFHVICANVIGGCMGSTGPASEGPDGKPWGMRFPVITIRDMVRAQVALLDTLGVAKLHAVVGGSMGGMLALGLAANFPDRAKRVLAIATTARHSAQNIAFHEVGRQAIMADPNWQGGDYYGSKGNGGGKGPEKGLAVARMAAHITYLSEAGLTDIRYVDSGALVTADQIRRTGLEGIWIRGPFSLQAEALRATVTRHDGKPDYTGSGQYAMASWVLTGESRPYNAGAVANIKPAHDYGAVELVATLRALHERRLPPTAHLDTPDPAFALDLVHSARAAPGLRYAVSNSFAFGGTNAVIVAGREG